MKTNYFKAILSGMACLIFLSNCSKEDDNTPTDSSNNKKDTTTTIIDTVKKDTTPVYVPAYGDIYVESELFPFNGYMGEKNGKSMTIDPKCTTNPHSGKYCMAITLDGTENWCGNVMFSATPWTEKVGKDMKGYKKLVFWTRCSQEAIGTGTIHMGMKVYNTGFYGLFFKWADTNWRKIEVLLPGEVETIPINYMFEFSQASPKPGMTIYIDDIQYIK